MVTMKKYLLALAVVAVAGAFFFSGGAARAAHIFPDGALVKERGGSKVYEVFQDGAYWIRTPAVFRAYGFSWKNVREVASGALGGLAPVKLITHPASAKIYYIENEKARWIVSPEAFNANGFNWSAIKPVNAIDLESYEAGPEVSGDISGKTVTVEITPIAPSLQQSAAPAGVDFSLLWNVWSTIEEKYRNSGALDRARLVQGAAEGVVKALSDPYTVFLKPDDARKFSQDVEGEFFGIGAELGYKKGIVIVAPLEGLPAHKAGMKAGDKIVKINDESAADMTVEDAVTRIRGKKGTQVTLTIVRGESDVPIEFTVVRDLVKVATVEWSRKTNDVFYIKIHNFFGNVEADFMQAVKEAQAGGMRKLVLDVRNNPGGLLDASIAIASQFIPKGKAVVSADFGAGKRIDDFVSYGGGTLENTPMAVLINGGSASAAEIFAGALKDTRGISLIGEKTFGKGTIQEVNRFAGGASLKVTVAQWLRPSGSPIDGRGIEPDIAVAFTDEDKTAGRDPQLDKALQIVQGLPL